MKSMTARLIAHAVLGEVVAGPSQQAFTAITTDSRKPAPGALFVALAGPRFDGHTFVRDALNLGAAGALVDARHIDAEGRLTGPLADLPPAAIIAVTDTQRALEDLGRAIRLRHSGLFIAVTGSVGKTTIKDMLTAALAPFGPVASTPGNLNNRIGLPLTLAQTTGDEDHVVLELGMSAAGEIAHLATIARPDVAIVCAAAAAHLANFDSVDAIADAKCELFEHLHPDTISVANADDPRVIARARHIIGDQLITWGKAPSSTVQVIGARHVRRAEGPRLEVTLAIEEDALTLDLQTLGAHNASNAAAALAVVYALGLDVGAAAQALSDNFRAPKGRLQTHTAGLVTVIDDSYNANPASMNAAFDCIAALHADLAESPRLVLVLGTMHELGPESTSMHEAISRRAAALSPALVIATGPEATALVSALPVGCGMTMTDLETALPDLLASCAKATGPTLVLIKGSRAERLERALVPILSAATAPHLEGGA